MKKILYIILLTVSIHSTSNLMIFDMKRNQIDADVEVEKIKHKISLIDAQNDTINTKLEVKSIKVGDRWIIASPIRGIKEINKISLYLSKEFPSILIVSDSRNSLDFYPKIPKYISNIHHNNLAREWITIFILGVIGLSGVIVLVNRASKIKKIQDELEYKQKKLMKNLLKSESHV